jgi:hypothetical protein
VPDVGTFERRNVAVLPVGPQTAGQAVVYCPARCVTEMGICSGTPRIRVPSIGSNRAPATRTREDSMTEIVDARRQHRGSRWTSVRAKFADVDELIEVHRRRYGRSRSTRGLAGAPVPERRLGVSLQRHNLQSAVQR